MTVNTRVGAEVGPVRSASWQLHDLKWPTRKSVFRGSVFDVTVVEQRSEIAWLTTLKAEGVPRGGSHTRKSIPGLGLIPRSVFGSMSCALHLTLIHGADNVDPINLQRRA